MVLVIQIAYLHHKWFSKKDPDKNSPLSYASILELWHKFQAYFRDNFAWKSVRTAKTWFGNWNTNDRPCTTICTIETLNKFLDPLNNVGYPPSESIGHGFENDSEKNNESSKSVCSKTKYEDVRVSVSVCGILIKLYLVWQINIKQDAWISIFSSFKRSKVILKMFDDCSYTFTSSLVDWGDKF